MIRLSFLYKSATVPYYTSASLLSTPSRFQALFSTALSEPEKKGQLVGVYTSEDSPQFTSLASKLNKKLNGRLWSSLSPHFLQKSVERVGSTRYLYFPDHDSPHIVVSSLGKMKEGDEADTLDATRKAAAAGLRQLSKVGVQHVEVDSFFDVAAAAEGATLASYKFNDYKSPDPEAQEINEPITISPLSKSAEDQSLFDKGKLAAEVQNLARDLANSPANLMTPTLFAKKICELCSELPTIRTVARDQDWIEEQNMNCFLGVAKGSSEAPVFLEIFYTPPGGSTAPPLIFVGKGVTFDSGGISIKPSANMSQMKADMSGAGCVAAALYGLGKAATCKRPVIGLIPLCENMPSGSALKPGDLLYASDGTSVEIDNTDAEGRLILADALVYADQFSPEAVVSVATLTGAIDVALGSEFIGAFTAEYHLFSEIEKAGRAVGDAFWRMPLTIGYQKVMKKSEVADFTNSGGRSGGACTAAGFLWHFTKNSLKYAHLDIAGLMHRSSTSYHHSSGMTGGPSRTLMKLAESSQLAEVNP